MCGGGRSAPPPSPPRMAVAPMLRTPRPVRDVPKPQDIADYTEDPNFITGKKRTRLSAETIRKGTKVFDALDKTFQTQMTETKKKLYFQKKHLNQGSLVILFLL